jgi:hypothetical protein
MVAHHLPTFMGHLFPWRQVGVAGSTPVDGIMLFLLRGSDQKLLFFIPQLVCLTYVYLSVLLTFF